MKYYLVSSPYDALIKANTDDEFVKTYQNEVCNPVDPSAEPDYSTSSEHQYVNLGTDDEIEYDVLTYDEAKDHFVRIYDDMLSVGLGDVRFMDLHGSDKFLGDLFDSLTSTVLQESV